MIWRLRGTAAHRAKSVGWKQNSAVHEVKEEQVDAAYYEFGQSCLPMFERPIFEGY
jgi:hypothetical protein